MRVSSNCHALPIPTRLMLPYDQESRYFTSSCSSLSLSPPSLLI